MRILLTGAKGQLGQEFMAIAPAYPGFELIAADRHTLDVGDRASVESCFARHLPQVCINCAAYTAVDAAEQDAAAARRANVDGPRHLAEACASAGIPLVHFSTDYVYHSQQNRPFREDDPTSPQGVYAQTKWEGEQAALAAHPGTMVLRTSWVYSAVGHNFLNTMLRLAQSRDHLNVVFDQIGTPTYARDLAHAVLHILQQCHTGQAEWRDLGGIYHYSNEGVCSWYDFAVAIFELRGLACQVSPILSAQYPTPAQRPPFSVLDKTKIKAAFGLHIPHWRESLKDCLAHRTYE